MIWPRLAVAGDDALAVDGDALAGRVHVHVHHEPARRRGLRVAHRGLERLDRHRRVVAATATAAAAAVRRSATASATERSRRP